MKRILIINGHPDRKSYGATLFEAYKRGALTSSDQYRAKWLVKIGRLGSQLK